MLTVNSTESGIVWEDPPTEGGTIPTGILDTIRITMHTEPEDEQGHKAETDHGYTLERRDFCCY